MPDDTSETSLHPDVVAYGGLLQPMNAIAKDEGINLGRISDSGTSTGGISKQVEGSSGRGEVHVYLNDCKRSFYLLVQGRGFTWTEGATSDLRSLTSAVSAWISGVSLDRFIESFPFMTLGRLAKAHEQECATEFQWDWLRTTELHVHEHPVIEAAYANQNLRRLFPNISHGTLLFNFPTAEFETRTIRIIPLEHGSYRIEDTAVPKATIANSAQDAAELAAKSLIDPSS